MAKLKLTTLIGNNFEVWDAYSGDINPHHVKPKEAVYLDYNYSSVIFTGTSMKGEGDYMTKGDVSAVAFDNYQGKHFLTVTGLDLKAANLSHVLMDEGVEALMTYILKGKDTIKGTSTDDVLKGGARDDKISGGAGSDEIHGQGGNDTLTGNGGTDYFYLQVGGNKDVVTDFVTGEGPNHDYVHLDYGATYEIIDNKKGAIVKLGTGETMQLLGVDAEDVLIFQDYVPPAQF